jgi:hypothetical protein
MLFSIYHDIGDSSVPFSTRDHLRYLSGIRIALPVPHLAHRRPSMLDREWALHQGWDGKPMKHEHVQGMLVAALGVLASHYGYQQSRMCIS